MPKPTDKIHSDKVILVNVKPSDRIQPTVVSASQISPALKSNPPNVQFITANNQIQLVSSNSAPTSISSLSFSPNAPVQLMLSPVSTANEKVVHPTIQNTSEIITKVRSRQTDLTTAISLINKMNKETEETMKKPNNKETFAEELSIVLPKSDVDVSSGSDTANAETTDDEEFVEELVFNEDTEDNPENMVDLGYNVKVCDKKLKKCIQIGTTATKLTRCLMSILFPDISVLAQSSVFGRKSNVTKLTRPALHLETIQAILDFVIQKYPTAQKTDLVLAMNFKCSEARRYLNRRKNKEKKNSTDITSMDVQKENKAEKYKSMDGSSVRKLSENELHFPVSSTANKTPINDIPKNSSQTAFDLLVLPQIPKVTSPSRTVVSTQGLQTLSSTMGLTNAYNAKQVINSPLFPQSASQQIDIKPNAALAAVDITPNNALQLQSGISHVQSVPKENTSPSCTIVSSEPVNTDKSPPKTSMYQDPALKSTDNMQSSEVSSADEGTSPLVIVTTPDSSPASPDSPLQETT